MCVGAEIFRPYLFGKKNLCYLSPRLTNCTGQLYYVEMSCLNLFILCVYINYEIPPGKKVRLMTMGTMRWLKCICGKARHHVPCCVRWVHIDNSLVHRCTPYASIQARDSERGKISVRASAQYIGSGCVRLAGGQKGGCQSVQGLAEMHSSRAPLCHINKDKLPAKRWRT